MKSFFQLFHDSQSGTSKSKTKDVAYKQRILTPKPEQDRVQSPNGAESSSNPTSKRHTTKTARFRTPDVPKPEAPGRVATDNLTRYSTFPGSSTNRHHAPINVPTGQPLPHNPSTSTALNLKPPDNVREKHKVALQRDEVTDLTGDEREARFRVKPERLSRSDQTNGPSVPEQQPQIWHPVEPQTGITESRKKKGRQKQVDESDGGDTRVLRSHRYPDRKDVGVGEYKSDREHDNGIHLQSGEKDRDLDNSEHRNQARGGVMKEVQRWEQQEKDIRQLRERERDQERKEKQKQRDRARARERLRDEEREKQKEGEKGQDKEGKRERDKEREKEREKDGGRESWEEQQKRAQKDREVKEKELRLEREKREAREQQERERQAKEQRDRERRERKARELTERAERERKEREDQERERKEKERHDREQQERWRQQEEQWERQQEEVERREFERIQKERHQDERRLKKDLHQRDPDTRELDILRIERERQEKRKRERENWEQRREREREERGHRRRADRQSEPPEAVLTDTGTNDKASIRSQNKHRRDGMSDSEREQADLRELDRRRLSRMTTQTNTPPKPDDRKFPIIEASRPVEPLTSRNSGPSMLDSTTRQREEPRQPLREDGYVSELNAPNRVLRAPSVRGLPALESSKAIASSAQPVHSAPPTSVHPSLNPLGQPFPVQSRINMASDTPSRIHSSNQAPPTAPAHPPDQKTNSILGSFLQTPTHLFSRSGFASTDPRLHDTHAVSAPLPSNSTRTNEQPQGIRILPVPSIIQNSYSNATSVSRISTNPSSQDASSIRDTRSSGQTGLLSTIHEDRPISPAMNPNSYPALTVPPNGIPSVRVDHLINHDSPLGQINGRQTPTSLSQNAMSFNSNSHLNLMPLNQHDSLPSLNSYPPVRILQPSAIVDLSIKEHATLHRHAVKGSPGSEGGFSKAEHVLVTSPSQAQPPIAVPVSESSRTAHVHKRVNSAPAQYESQKESTLPSGNTKPIHTYRPSPKHAFARVHDETTPPNEPITLQASQQDSKLQGLNEKGSLQEPPLPYPSDKSNHQDNRVPRSFSSHPEEILSQPETRAISHNARDSRRRAQESARQGPSTDFHDASLSRHQRHHSESEVGRRNIGSSQLQLTENHQVTNAKHAGFIDSNSKPSHNTIRSEESRNETKAVKIALRTPVMDAVDDQKRVADPRQSVHTTDQDPGKQKLQQVQKQDANNVPTLVSHYERIEESVRLGGNITRPGTVVPQSSTTRPTGLEAVPLQTKIDRPNTAAGIRSSAPSATQLQPLHGPAVPSINFRSKLELISFPDMKLVENRDESGPLPTHVIPSTPFSSAKPPRAGSDIHAVPTSVKYAPRPMAAQPILEVHDDHYLNQAVPNNSSSTKGSWQAQTMPAYYTAADRPATRSQMPADHLSRSRKNSYTEEPPISEVLTKGSIGPAAFEDHGVASTTLPLEVIATDNRTREQSALPIQVDRGFYAQSHSDHALRKDNTGNSARESTKVHSSSQSRQRKESSPRVRTRDDPPKAPAAKDGDTEDRRFQSHRSSHVHDETRGNAPSFDVRHISQRTEPTRVETVSMAGPPIHRYATDSSIQSFQPAGYSNHLPLEDRSRNKHSLGNQYPNVSQRTPPVDPASISPQRTGNSIHHKADEEGTQRSHKHSLQVKDIRLADLLSPPKPNEVFRQSYLQDARRNFASKLENQSGGSPNSAQGNSGSETSGRLRGSSGRGEHSPRYPQGGDSSPSGPSNSPTSHNQQPDLPTRDHGYVRSSPNASNTSHHTPSPRTKAIVTESYISPQGTLSRDGGPRYVGAHPSRQPPARDKRQDYHATPDAEQIQSRKHDPSSYTSYDTDKRTDDTKRTAHIPSHPIPYQSLDSNPGKTISQKDGLRRDTYDIPQTITTSHTRTRSNSQNMQEASASHPHSRHTHSTSTPTLTKNPSHVPPSNHVPASAPSIPFQGQSTDQMQHFRSSSSNQPSTAMKEEITTPRIPTQPTPIVSTPSKRNYISPLPSETPNANASPTTQPPTPKPYEIWLPPPSSQAGHGPSRPTPAPSHRREYGREREHIRRVSTVPRDRPFSPEESRHLALQPPDPRIFNAYHYIKTRKIRTMSLVSVEAQDGAASTVIGSPTASIVSTVPINIPPEQDPIIAAREWTERAAIVPGPKIRRPGLVWELPEDPPPVLQQEPRSVRSRRHRSPGSRSRETSDTDQPSSS